MNASLAYRPPSKISICLADEQDREVIYKMRQEVYARELRQHLENKEGRLEELSGNLDELGWEVFPSCANFLLCHLPIEQPRVIDVVETCRKRNLFLRDVSGLGKCFDQRTLRIAVKDRQTNSRMVEILKEVLTELGVRTVQEERMT